ncbi:Eco57I restriction-modification methylase domain-containing protein [Planctomycetota bacterium]
MSSKSLIKANGVHYTPPELATFLAEVTFLGLQRKRGPIKVLDPACGDGGLLLAFANTVPVRLRQELLLAGYEKDGKAAEYSKHILGNIDVGEVRIQTVDFLSLDGIDSDGKEKQQDLFDRSELNRPTVEQFDVVIANPPYVRTQVLGAEKARELASRFSLTGRVDLYQAFIKAMAAVLCPGGTLGLLTSNRFLFTQSGADIRRFFRTEFDLQAVYDLGDTKLFSAAVLPAIIVARKMAATAYPTCCTFERVYEHRFPKDKRGTGKEYSSVLEALRNKSKGIIHTGAAVFSIEQGVLAATRDIKSPWFLSTPDNQNWLKTVESNRTASFEEVGKIRVGVKTTADAVFIRDDWEHLPLESQPEAELLHTLITHCDAARWKRERKQSGSRRILYPYCMKQGKREVIRLEAYPGARSYLESNRERLSQRSYVTEAGRQWYEIWVPQIPRDWTKPKIVFPDIAEHPRFFLDRTGDIVNGDCYWITLKPGKDRRWLFVMLAVANSSFITKYYDTVFHNKLYSGRRRFLTQYVKTFPLPDPDSPPIMQAIQHVADIVEDRVSSDNQQRLESIIDALVWKSFGLSEKVSR